MSHYKAYKPHVKKLPRQSEEGYRQKKEGGSEELWEGNKEMTKFMQEKTQRVRRLSLFYTVMFDAVIF